MKILGLVLLLAACGKTPAPPLGCCLLPLGDCIDFTNTTPANVLDSDSARFTCDNYGALYGEPTCAKVMTNAVVATCALAPRDGVQETYSFYAPTTADEVQQACTQAGGKFGTP